MKAVSHKRITAALLVLILLLGLAGFARALPTLVRIPDQRALPTLVRIPDQLDFGAYYVAARLINADLPLYQPSSASSAAAGVDQIPHSGYIYPPFFAAVLRPLAALPYRAAEGLWFGLNILC